MAITIEQSGAFIETFTVEPTGEGPLTGLSFAVKDLIDVAGHKTGCGNPTWAKMHPPARSHAACVEQLLAAGARCTGKTLTDELAFSLLGENHFLGTPLNPKAPNRVPGGSSNGSASAVACQLVDFALGSDTGGSVRVPASNCGIWGIRPSHDAISVAGVMPFAPTFDTVGVLAKNADILARASGVLLGANLAAHRDTVEPSAIMVVREAFDLADPAIRQAHEPAIERLRRVFGNRVRDISLRDIAEKSAAAKMDPEFANFESWFDTYCVIQWGEIENSLGPWIQANNPAFGPVTTKSFDLVKNLDRRRVPPAIVRRESYARAMRRFLGPRDVLCIPTAPAPAPVKGTLTASQSSKGYYRRALSLTALAGICRLPQVSLPLSTGRVDDENLPAGLSLLASSGEDLFLLDVVQRVGADSD